MNNNRALFLASFMTLIAAGAGFAIRGAILVDWGSNFGFTKGELGSITGGGLVGFGVVILIGSVLADRLGYKTIMIAAFFLHVLSAIVTLAATPVYAMEAYGERETYWLLFVGMFMFSVANGLCEAVINPLVATLYPKQKTHYLNILHAGWPGGLIVGGILGYLFCGPEAIVSHLRWEIPMMFFLVPTLFYGGIVLKESFPLSEAKAAGVDFATMLKEFAAPIFLFLLVLHAMVGFVELGTDSWITNIMNNVIEGQAILLFIYTSAIMFVLRFFAGPIVEKINPVGLLLVSAVTAAVGLYWLGTAGAGFAVIAAATVYGLGKTFFWPTMLGVVGERFPKGGALTMGAVGGIGMLSAGLLGGPGIGYMQDYYASQRLEQLNPEAYAYYRSDDKSGFLFFPEIYGLDGKKVGDLNDKIKNIKTKTKKGAPLESSEQLTVAEQEYKGAVNEATIYGGRMALKWTALVPATMAVGYLLLLLYFRARGGYKQEVLHGEEPEGERYTGGVEAPVEA